MAKGVARETDSYLDHLLIYGDDVRLRIPSIEKANEVLGWQPKVSVDEALDMCLDRVASKTG